MRSPSRLGMVLSSSSVISSSRAPSNTGVATLVPGSALSAPIAFGPVDLPASAGHPPEVGLQDLADVHSTGHTERVEDDVDRGAVLQERHVLDRQHLGDDALVAVTTGQLVAVGDLALLGHV